MHCSDGQASEEDGPSFLSSLMTSRLSDYHIPWAKCVHTHRRKWRSWGNTVFWKICHPLELKFSPQLSASYTASNECVQNSFYSHYPKSSIAKRPVSYVPPLMTNLLVNKHDKQFGKVSFSRKDYSALFSNHLALDVLQLEGFRTRRCMDPNNVMGCPWPDYCHYLMPIHLLYMLLSA